MNVAQEIQRLQLLNSNGYLTDDEFTRAKAAILANYSAGGPASSIAAPVPSNAADRKNKKSRGWFIVVGILLVISLIAFFTNPNETSFQSEFKAADNRGIVEKLAGDLLFDMSFRRTNYFVFSLGTMSVKVRTTGETFEIKYVGAFGKWWHDYPLEKKWKGNW